MLAFRAASAGHGRLVQLRRSGGIVGTTGNLARSSGFSRNGSGYLPGFAFSSGPVERTHAVEKRDHLGQAMAYPRLLTDVSRKGTADSRDRARSANRTRKEETK
jgi:hypothetical protein